MGVDEEARLLAAVAEGAEGVVAVAAAAAVPVALPPPGAAAAASGPTRGRARAADSGHRLPCGVVVRGAWVGRSVEMI